jgi:large repetitive protein
MMTRGRRKLQSKGLMVIAAFFLLESATALAQSGGTFTPTGSITIARSGHTATVLPNGKILIAGGYSGSARLASAELYDPATGTFARTGDMTTPRAGNKAVLLPNGKVLIAGAGDVGAELYDPSTGTFTATGGPIPGAFPQAEGTTAILLADGTALFGLQLYDPIMGTFSIDGSAFWADQAFLLPNGRVFLAKIDWPVLSLYAAVYDPVSRWTQSTGAPADTNLLSDEGVGGTSLANGKVLLAGGISKETNLFSTGAELYDPLTGTFSATGDMTLGRAHYTATPLGDGSVLIAGSSGVDVSMTAELYDPVAGQFSRTGNPTVARLQGQTATLLQDGTVLFVGGRVANPTSFHSVPSASAEVYKPSNPVPAPLLFSVSGDGQGQGVIWDPATGQIVSADNPAIAGEPLAMYTTSLVEGGAVPPQVSVGGRLAEILYFGDAPGYPGYFQINFRVPDGISPGAAVSVGLTYLGRPSNGVTIAVQ